MAKMLLAISLVALLFVSPVMSNISSSDECDLKAKPCRANDNCNWVPDGEVVSKGCYDAVNRNCTTSVTYSNWTCPAFCIGPCNRTRTKTLTIEVTAMGNGTACPDELITTATEPGCPSCEDGVQNQGEYGVDCGGPCDTAELNMSHTRRCNYVNASYNGCSNGEKDDAEEYIDCGIKARFCSYCVKREISFKGDYDTMTDATKTEFLDKCSKEYEPVTCASVTGTGNAIIVTYAGSVYNLAKFNAIEWPKLLKEGMVLDVEGFKKLDTTAGAALSHLSGILAVFAAAVGLRLV